jgi:hypothetical protein
MPQQVNAVQYIQEVTHMRQVAVFAGFILLYFTQFAVAATPAAPDAQLILLEQRAAKAATSVAGEYAKSLLDAAKASIAEAKIYSAAGKEKLASRQVELADVLLNAADAKGSEKELLERVAVRRSELKKSEARLERFKQGEEN